MKTAWSLFGGSHNLSLPGIYGILCLKTGDWYVGSCNRTMQIRNDEHTEALHKGTHHNSHLQRLWNKYGPKAFRFYALQHSNKRNLFELETRWILKKNATLNICWPGGQVLIRRDKDGRIIPLKNINGTSYKPSSPSSQDEQFDLVRVLLMGALIFIVLDNAEMVTALFSAIASEAQLVEYQQPAIAPAIPQGVANPQPLPGSPTQ